MASDGLENPDSSATERWRSIDAGESGSRIMRAPRDRNRRPFPRPLIVMQRQIRTPGSGLLQFAGWFVLVLILKQDHWLSPPAWDSAMGVFPPAVFLLENGFDLALLMQQPDWWQGGPNVHSLSLFTWLVAATMALTRDPQVTLLALHGATYLLTALSLWWYSRLLGAMEIDPPTANLAALVLLLCPLVLVQAERLYTEIPLMACHVGSALLLCRNRQVAAALVALAALAIKMTAVALVAGLALVLLLGIRRNLKAGLAALVVLLLGSGLILLLPFLLGSVPAGAGGWGDPDLLMTHLALRLESIADITLVMKLALAAALFLPLWWGFRGRGKHHYPAWLLPAMLVLLVPVLFSAGVIVGAFRGNLFLPRYLVAVIPLAMASVVLLGRELLPRWVLLSGLSLCAIYFVLNHQGRYYPPNHDSFSVVERSHAYRAFNRVKARALDAIGKRQSSMPAYVTREIHYMNSSRYMGYADPVHAHVYGIFVEPHRSRSLDAYPARFMLVKGSRIHGGKVIDRLVAAARASPRYQVSEERFESAGFAASVFSIERLD